MHLVRKWPDAWSITESLDLQSSMLPLYYSCSLSFTMTTRLTLGTETGDDVIFTMSCSPYNAAWLNRHYYHQRITITGTSWYKYSIISIYSQKVPLFWFTCDNGSIYKSCNICNVCTTEIAHWYVHPTDTHTRILTIMHNAQWYVWPINERESEHASRLSWFVL